MGARAEKLAVGYYVHYPGDRINRSPNLSIIHYTLITNLHIYSLKSKIKTKIKIRDIYRALQSLT